MNHLLAMALGLLVLAPQNQQLPDAIYNVPEQLRSQATVIVAGTYDQGRSPCIFMPDGSRRWYLQSWFQIKKVYRGEIGGKSIYLQTSLAARNQHAGVTLEVGHEYLVLLRPSEESMKAIKARGYFPAWDALPNEEIIAVVELK